MGTIRQGGTNYVIQDVVVCVTCGSDRPVNSSLYHSCHLGENLFNASKSQTLPTEYSRDG